MAGTPLIWPPTRPSDLLSHIIARGTYPLTLIVGAPRTDFLSALLHDVHAPDRSGDEAKIRGREALLSASLYQTAIAKHIRILFCPSVTHLRAALSVFSPADANIPIPPANYDPRRRRQPPEQADSSSSLPALIVFGLLDLHRDTSEWNAQGLSASAATLVEAARRTGFRAVVVEPCDELGRPSLGDVLGETVPLLRHVGEVDWSGKEVSIRRVLERWFEARDDILVGL